MRSPTYTSVYSRASAALASGMPPAGQQTRRTGLNSVFDAIAAVPEFGTATEKWLPWTREYDRDQWLDLLLSRSDHLALDAAVRDRLLAEIGAAIDDYGGSFVMSFESVLITATRRGCM